MNSLRLLLLKSVDPSFDAFAHILESEGHDVVIKDRTIAISELEGVIDRHRPDLIIANNNDLLSIAIRPDPYECEEFLFRKQIPLSIWDYEHPMLSGATPLIRRWCENSYPQFPLYFNVDSYWANEYRKKKLNAHFLPFGVDERLKLFSPSPHFNHLKHDLVYIGTAFVGHTPEDLDSSLETLQRYFALEASAQVAASVFDSQSDKTPNKTKSAEEILDIVFDEFQGVFSLDIHDPLVLYEASDKVASRILQFLIEETKVSVPDYWHLIRLRCQIGYTYYQVVAKLHDLLEDDIRVYGEGAWNQLLPSYKYHARRLSYEEMYNCWALSKITFCLTKKLFVNCVHERVLHILGAGGFPLIDKRGDIDSLFSSAEIATYTEWGEAKDKIRFYLKNDQERNAIILKGRQRVFSEHTYRHRLRVLLQKSSDHFGFKYQIERKNIQFHEANDWIKTIDHAPKI